MKTSAEDLTTDAKYSRVAAKSNFSLYRPLFKISAAILECTREMQEETSWRRRYDLKRVAWKFDRMFNEKSAALIKRTVDSWDQKQSLSSCIADELEAMKADAGEHWHKAIDYVKVRLTELAEGESRKSWTRRKLERNGWWLTGLAAGILVIFLKWYWLVDVNYPSETTEGVLQGSAAMEKLVFYDDSPAARLDDVGLIKRIVLWPVKPTEEEMEYAWEFMRTAVDVYDFLKKENKICGAELTHSSVNGHFKDELAIAGIVVDYINSTGRVNRSESGIRLMERAFKRQHYCG